MAMNYGNARANQTYRNRYSVLWKHLTSHQCEKISNEMTQRRMKSMVGVRPKRDTKKKNGSKSSGGLESDKIRPEEEMGTRRSKMDRKELIG